MTCPEPVGGIADALGDRLTVTTSQRLGLVNLAIADGRTGNTAAVACLTRDDIAHLADLLATAVLNLKKAHR